MILHVLGSFAPQPRPHRPIRAANAVFPLPVEEKAPPEASKCSKRQRRGGGFCTWDSPTLFPLPVDEKAIMNNTPDKRACDGHFPLPVKGKAIPSYEAPRSPAEPFRALRSSVRTPATEPCRVPRKSFSGKGKANRRHPTTTFASTGRRKRDSQTHATFP